MDQHDLSLWEAFLSGDDDAYAAIYTRYVQMLFAYAMQFTADRELAKDAIQEMFVTLLRKRQQLKSTDNLKLYLFVVMKNTLLNHIKKELTYRDYIIKVESQPIETPLMKLEMQEAQNRLSADIRQAFDRLSPREREVMYLRYVDELDIDAICTLTGIRYQSVQNTMQRALKKLKELFPPGMGIDIGILCLYVGG
ncbi:MAG: sigma-70 family RNA polymerase sigma factor [Prevotellaceae bacterium]|jgi:RNA polymerase sigma factor (sigma-70 family)|nr:sigma-70 family RNA polymerase sigma factor [Prevotellaceae bacterium]